MQAFRKRVGNGLLTGKPHRRSNYVVSGGNGDRLHVRAADWWTATNVGLNKLDLELAPKGTLRYRVRYWRWTTFAVGGCGLFALIGLLLILTTDVRGYIAQSPSRMIPGFSVEQNIRFLWAMVVFWGFVWPWLLVQLHKRPLRGLVTRILAEVDAQASAPK